MAAPVAAHLARGPGQEVLAAEEHLTAHDPRGGSRVEPQDGRHVRLLPLPDSPTRPRVSPRRSAKLTPSTAFPTPRRVKNQVLRSRTSRTIGSTPTAVMGAGSAAAQEATHTVVDLLQDLGDLLVRRRRHRMKHRGRRRGGPSEHTVEHQQVQGPVNIQGRSEAPDKLRQSALPRPSRARRSTLRRVTSRAGRWRRFGCQSIRSTASESRSSLATAATRWWLEIAKDTAARLERLAAPLRRARTIRRWRIEALFVQEVAV